MRSPLPMSKKKCADPGSRGFDQLGQREAQDDVLVEPAVRSTSLLIDAVVVQAAGGRSWAFAGGLEVVVADADAPGLEGVGCGADHHGSSSRSGFGTVR